MKRDGLHAPPSGNPAQYALRVIGAFGQGRFSELPSIGSIRGFAVLNAIVARNRIDAARAYAGKVRLTGQETGSFSTFLTFLRQSSHSDRARGGGSEFADRATEDVQIVRANECAPVLFVFCGQSGRFGVPLNLIHRWFARLGMHLVYLRDARRLFYVCGIRSFGRGRADSLSALRRIATDLRATSIACTGNSAGSYGALRFGLDLGARAVLAFAGPTALHRVGDGLLAAARRHGHGLGKDDIERSSLRDLYAQTANPPRVRIVYGAESPVDRLHALAMAGLPDVDLLAIPGVSQHLVLGELLARGAFENTLAWLQEAPMAYGGKTSERSATDLK